MHTSDIRGEWSDPVWVEQGGIDPTLFFDGEDVYFASTSLDEMGRAGIFMCKINPYTGEKLTDSVCISYGCGGRCPEGPHLYKWFGKYYLLLAEGGTEYGESEPRIRFLKELLESLPGTGQVGKSTCFNKLKARIPLSSLGSGMNCQLT